jgi:hypothetical protein
VKITVFYEGQSEEQLIRVVLNRSRQPVDVVQHYRDFLDASDGNHIYLHDCGGYQNVFPEAARASYLYKQGESVIVMRDLEDACCYSELRAEMTAVCTDLPPPPMSKVVFTKPSLEAVYFADTSVLARVIEVLHREKFDFAPDRKELARQIAALNPLRPLPELKDLLASYSMAYRKPRFAREYFERINLGSFPHTYVRRTMEALHPAIE